MSVDTIVRIRTYAKLNLFLRILGKRTDGFHEVETILHGVGLYDEIEIEPAAEGIEVTMELAGITGTVPTSGENLIGRAARLLADELPGVNGAIVRVKKGIPIGAGLGGGSGNAAGALVGLAEVWGLGFERERLFTLAERLGSDVPYFIDGGTALATARGEQTTPLPNIRSMWFVLGGSDRPLLTRDVYEAWDESGSSDEVKATPIAMALGAGDLSEVAALLHNDLEAPAFELRPELEAKKQSFVDAGALGACMSGSGPTLYGIAADRPAAEAIAERVAGEFDWVRVVSSQSRCIERLG